MCHTHQQCAVRVNIRGSLLYRLASLGKPLTGYCFQHPNMKQVLRAFLFCCRDRPTETLEPDLPSPLKPQTEPSEFFPRAESPEPEPISASQPAADFVDMSEEDQQNEGLKAGEASAEEVLVQLEPVEPKKKREKKTKKKEPRSVKKKPSFKSGSMSARGKDPSKEGLHKPLPPSARPLKGILKKK